MAIEPIVDSLINLIKLNVIAKTNVTSNITTGDVIVNVENSFHFRANEEIILIDYNYDVVGSSHYQIFEYAKIKEVNNTSSITLSSPALSDWTVANNAFVQKTIGHSPLYDDNVLYGDREVIPTDAMAITVEPVSMSNEWVYLQGGLSEDYKIKVTVYGKSIETDEGRRILDRYSDNVVDLLNSNIHVGVATYSAPLLVDVNIGDTQITIAATQDNIDNIVLSTNLPPLIFNQQKAYQLQDNKGVGFWVAITNIQFVAGNMVLTIDTPYNIIVEKSEYATIKRLGMYIYDSRADLATYGVISKGSAILRASEINWFGKVIKEYKCPQLEYGLNNFSKIP